jgi:4-carboxymuconolactone decarboxylase
MSRLPTLRRDELSLANQQVWDRVMSGRTGSGGPYGVLIHAPALAERLAAVENYFRNDAVLAATDKELVILATAREVGARFPWTRHEIRARQAGVSEEAIEALRAHGSLATLTAHERLLVEIVHSLLRDHRLSEKLFAWAHAELGTEQLIEVVGLVGHYNLIGSVVNAFDIAVPPGSRTF